MGCTIGGTYIMESLMGHPVVCAIGDTRPMGRAVGCAISSACTMGYDVGCAVGGTRPIGRVMRRDTCALHIIWAVPWVVPRDVLKELNTPQRRFMG